MNKQKGFTIIEVLIASFILFLVISSASLIFNSTIKSKIVATTSLQLHGYVPLIMDYIGVQIRRSGTTLSSDIKTDYLLGVNYQWNARISQRKPITAKQDGVTISQSEAILWSVDLKVFDEKKSESFNFSIVSWQPL